MERGKVIRLAKRVGWKQRGGFRRYGPNWYECYRRRNQYIWIGFSTLEGAPEHDSPRNGFVKPPLDYTHKSESQVTLWLAEDQPTVKLYKRVS